MDNTPVTPSPSPGRRIHPLVAGAAVSVTLVSLVGVAAITGILPSSHSSSDAPVAAASNYPDQNGQTNGQANGQAYSSNQGGSQAPVASNGSNAMNGNAAGSKGSTNYPQQGTQVAQAEQNSQPAQEQAAICKHCGKVESIEAVQQQAKTSGLGIAAGAVLGGILGHQVGNGNGRSLATVAGAVGGGYAGNEVEKRSKTNTTYRVKVRMDDGTYHTFPQDNWQVGDRVKEVHGKLVPEN